jgi:hypothetical protein
MVSPDEKTRLAVETRDLDLAALEIIFEIIITKATDL